MYYYCYTNDMRTSILKEETIKFAKQFLGDKVPTAKENKSENNKANTIGFYLNLINKGECAKVAALGDVRAVTLNFIKKFQYPNPRRKESLSKCKEYGIRIAPLREVVKLLFVAKQIDSNEVYLTKEEVLEFIFYNDKVAKSDQINRYRVYIDILESRKNPARSNSGNNEAGNREWNDQYRQIGELLSTLNYSGFIEYHGGKITLKDINEESLDLKAEVFDILTYEKYWEYEIPEDINLSDAKKSYYNYMDEGVFINEGLDINKELSTNTIELPYQRIFFGAPGTGKSYLLNKEAEKNFGDNYERVTFHPNYMYGNFIGSYKPFPIRIKGQEGEYGEYCDEFGNLREGITYKYIPGVLMKMLVKALLNPDTNYLLIIEEINRANVAAVFGDFFQLLDRSESGESEYAVSTSEEIIVYFQEKFNLNNVSEDKKKYIYSKLGENYSKLILPKNLYIWATMNSADQGVMPMDTAFKRRWEFEYIGVDEATKNTSDFDKYIMKISNNSTVKWNDFRVEVNNRLSSYRVPEDKLMGPYFIAKSTLESGDINKITNIVKNKVLMYLYEDAGKAYRNNLFVAEKAKTYSALCENFDYDGSTIFSKPLEIQMTQINNTNSEESNIVADNDSNDID